MASTTERKNAPDAVFALACTGATGIEEVRTRLAAKGFELKSGSISVRKAAMIKAGVDLPKFTRRADPNRAASLNELIAAAKAEAEADAE